MNFFEKGRQRFANFISPDVSVKPMEASHGTWGVPYVHYNGEKNAGEIGPMVQYQMDYYGLSTRSWKSYMDSEISKTVLNKFTSWMIDKGLKLQCQPSIPVLKQNGITLDAEKFNEIVEARFYDFMKSKRTSYNGMKSGSELSKECFKNAKIGGDVLVVLRVENKRVNIQLIDGVKLVNPMGSSFNDNVYDGVKVDNRGRHVEYYVKGKGLDTTTIKAFDSSGMRRAFLVYGDEYRLGDVRGIPAIATALETIAKLSRYKEATVSGVEERAKIVYSIEHDQGSDGTTPLGKSLGTMLGSDVNGGNPVDEAGNKLADRFAVTSNKTVYNMPINSKLASLDSKQETNFKEFYDTNADIICSALGIPPNVAYSVYNDSFSASRAATKDWEHTMDVERDNYSNQFYKYIYAFWFHVENLHGRISAPGYFEAFKSKDYEVIDAYLNCRFTGPNFPHIDPLKEVNAERAKLGPMFADTPLTTVERSTELLTGQDSASVMEQASRELETSKNLGLKEDVQNPE